MIDIAHTLQRQGPTLRLATLSGRVLLIVGFAAVPGEHPLRCWHVLAAVQPAGHVQHPGEMEILLRDAAPRVTCCAT